MHVSVALQRRRDFEVAASPAATHALLADVPRSASHYPGVERLVPLGDNAFRWELQRVGIGEIALQTVYACHYRDDPVALKTWWEPVPGAGNATVSGHWQLEPAARGTRVHLVLDCVFELPLPGLLAHTLEKIVGHELDRQLDLYTANLRRTLGVPR